MRHWIRRRSSLLPLPLLGAALLAGCVTSGTHREVVKERDALAERVSRLEASQASLDAERVALIDEMEDLHQEREELDEAVRHLRVVEADLSKELAARERELAQRSEELQRLKGTYEGLVSDLEAEVAAGQIEIEQLREGLRLNLSQEVLFPSGSAEVNASGRSVLARVADRVKELPHTIEVRGHTDDVPIRSSRYPSNWELAGARASRVVRLLEERGVDPRRLSAVSAGEHQPRAPNDSPKSRARNRRIEITLKPDPQAAASGASSAGAARGS